MGSLYPPLPTFSLRNTTLHYAWPASQHHSTLCLASLLSAPASFAAKVASAAPAVVPQSDVAHRTGECYGQSAVVLVPRRCCPSPPPRHGFHFFSLCVAPPSSPSSPDHTIDYCPPFFSIFAGFAEVANSLLRSVCARQCLCVDVCVFCGRVCTPNTVSDTRLTYRISTPRNNV